MPDMLDRVELQRYQLCVEGEMALSSDHRPVALTTTLFLDTNHKDCCEPRYVFK